MEPKNLRFGLTHRMLLQVYKLYSHIEFSGGAMVPPEINPQKTLDNSTAMCSRPGFCAVSCCPNVAVDLSLPTDIGGKLLVGVLPAPNCGLTARLIATNQLSTRCHVTRRSLFNSLVQLLIQSTVNINLVFHYNATEFIIGMNT